jgi:hypothetical protein
LRPTGARYEREILESVRPNSRIVAFVVKSPPRAADDAVTLSQKALGKNLRAAGVGRVTAIGVGRP